jgi:predicted dehydrogenase
MDIGSHRIDVMLQLLGDVERVQASVVASADYQAEQASTVILQFSSGAHGVLQCYFGTIATPDRLEIIGTEGRVTVEDLNLGNLSLFTSDGQQHEVHPPADNFHGPLISDFTAALREQRQPAVSGQIGKRTSELIQLAYADAGVY